MSGMFLFLRNFSFHFTFILVLLFLVPFSWLALGGPYMKRFMIHPSILPHELLAGAAIAAFVVGC